jgi:mRNA-degrading endonuclease toxin of MazEF toxin-antitoxin module
LGAFYLRGSEPGKRRPVVIIQSDAFNQSGISTVVCAIITSNTAIASLPGSLSGLGSFAGDFGD